METETSITAESGSRQSVKQFITPQDTSERHIAICFLLIIFLGGLWYLFKWDWIPAVCNNACGAILGFLTGKATAKLEQ
jgi:hypothetical protein